MEMNTSKGEEYLNILKNPSGYKRFDILIPCANHGRKFKEHKKLINATADLLRPVMKDAGIGFVSQAQHMGNMLDITISYFDQREEAQVLLDMTNEVLTSVLDKLPVLETGLMPDQIPFWTFRKDNSAVRAYGVFGQGRLQLVEVDAGCQELKSIKPYEAGMKTQTIAAGQYQEVRR